MGARWGRDSFSPTIDFLTGSFDAIFSSPTHQKTIVLLRLKLKNFFFLWSCFLMRILNTRGV